MAFVNINFLQPDVYSQLCSLMMIIIVFEHNIKLFFIKRGKNHYRQEVLQGQVIVKLCMQQRFNSQQSRGLNTQLDFLIPVRGTWSTAGSNCELLTSNFLL